MEKNNIKLREMTLSDLNELKSILATDFDDFWTYDILKEDLGSSFSKYIVLEKSNNIIGFLGIKTILNEAELMNIVIKKSEKSKGFASIMIEYVISLCKNNNISKLNLEVNVQNSIAINLYKKYNFKEVGLRKKYYNNTYDAILMSIDL